MAQTALVDIQNLAVLNWNANGIKRQKNLFSAFLLRHNIDVACITETHLIVDEPFKISGYNIYREDRIAPVASGGVAVIIKRKIKHNEVLLPQLSNIEACAVRLSLTNGGYLNVISAYKSPNKRLIQDDIENLFSLQYPTIILGDLNCKHVFWGCRVTNPNGSRLLNAVTNCNVNISTPHEPTFHPWQIDCLPDVLDIMMYKGFIPPIFQEVLPELDSDHLPIILSFIVHADAIQPAPRLITGKVNWEEFALHLDGLLTIPPNMYSKENIDHAIEHLIYCIQTATKRSIVRQFQKRPNSSRLIPPLRILRLIKEKHKLRRQWQRYRHPILKRQLNEATRNVKRELDEFRIQCYRSYISNIHPGDNTMWQATKRILRTPTIIPTLIENGIHFNSDAEKCNLFADYFETVFHPNEAFDENLETSVNDFIQSSVSTVELPIKFTSPIEIKNIISDLPSRKAPGHDMIPNIVLKHLTRKAIGMLASIYNACITISYFPDVWKHAELVVFHKPNKPKSNITSYRPISLLPTLSKVFEKVIQTRLLAFVDASGFLPHEQFGFRPNHSTTLQVLRIAETITRGFDNKLHSAAVFLDVAQAFDKVWHDGLLYKLHEFGIPLYIQQILKSFLLNRTFCVKLNSCFSTHKAIGAGVPQGSILGPLLFNIYMADIPRPPQAAIALYADDTAIITQDGDIDNAVDALQSSVDIFYEWFSKWRLKLNSSKCEAKVFSLKRYVQPPGITINGTFIPWNPGDQTIKYLGVHLDKRLTWNDHINKKLTQAYTRLSLMFPIINRKSSLKPECTLLIYKSILRPILTYACPVWGVVISKSKLERLQVFQNKILRIAVNSPWFIRNNQLHRELEIPMVETFLKKVTQNFMNSLNKSPGAVTFGLGVPTVGRRLQPRLPQDVLIMDEY